MKLKQIISIISLLTIYSIGVSGHVDTLDFRISVSADLETVEHYGGRGPADLPWGRWFGFIMEIEYGNEKVYEWLPEYKVQNIEYVILSGDSLQKETALRMYFDL